MFSGKYGTSVGDTLYQVILFFVYRDAMLRKYPGDELVHDVFQWHMFLMFLYGDDHIARWPKVFGEMYKLYPESTDCLDDFVNYCKQNFGMKYKAGFEERYSNPVGDVYFFTTESGFRQVPELTVKSPSFLKHRIVRVHLDGVMWDDPVPMKDLIDVVSKLGFGVKSSASLNRELAKTVAMAHLTTNLEGHCILRDYYDILRTMGAELTPEILSDFLDKPETNSLYLLRESGDCSASFPSLLTVFEKQYIGYNAKSGFCPRDNYGNKISAPRKYELWFPRLK